jgi:dipeptidyl aminopeptidase/acylaminoacyl peptidase
MEIQGSQIIFEEKLSPGIGYQRYLASYLSEGYKIYGLLTVPNGDPPPDGFKAIIFNHGYIPPNEYQTEERYANYVNYLAQSGFVVFKIDFRGHGQSEGFPSGAYFSPGYTIDAISALKSLQTLDYVDPDGIGMWGHSMGGNLVLRAMLVEPAVKAGVIWAGAVYSYQDFTTYGISDTSYRPPATPEDAPQTEFLSSSRIIFETYGWPDLDHPYWKAISLTENLAYLTSPIQLHHAENDPVVNINYSYGLAGKLQEVNKPYGFFIYQEGGHNLLSPAFEEAMRRTVQFFKDNL